MSKDSANFQKGECRYGLYGFAELLPRYFDLLLLDTTQNVSYRRQPGLIAVTMPVRVLEFVGTVNMMLQNLDRQVVKRKGKKPSARRKRRTISETPSPSSWSATI